MKNKKKKGCGKRFLTSFRATSYHAICGKTKVPFLDSKSTELDYCSKCKSKIPPLYTKADLTRLRPMKTSPKGYPWGICRVCKKEKITMDDDICSSCGMHEVFSIAAEMALKDLGLTRSVKSK